MNKDRNSASSPDKDEKAGLLNMSELTEEEIEFLNRPGTREVLNVHQGWRTDQTKKHLNFAQGF